MDIACERVHSAYWRGNLLGECPDVFSGQIQHEHLFEGVDLEDWIDSIWARIPHDGLLSVKLTLPCGAVVHIDSERVDFNSDIISVTVVGDVQPSGLKGAWVS